MVLGIDTSNYTTSVAALDVHNATFEHARKLLPVREGEKGLRQSEALFSHVRQLPHVFSDLLSRLHAKSIHPHFVRIAASVRPRPTASSYMPVFLAGESFAASFALAQGIPLTRTSHQEGHLSAAEYFLPMGAESFVAAHISGGTSDVMIARASSHGYAIDLIGEGLDLHAGQFVDRVGVQMGLPFPPGPQLEMLARLAGEQDVELPTAVHGAKMSFSGPLTAATRALEAGCNKADMARAVEVCIARSVAKALEFAVRNSSSMISRVLVVGGVASNEFIRTEVVQRLHRRIPFVKVEFAPSEFARDNALGVARIGQMRDATQ